jgi:hypothetical protein
LAILVTDFIFETSIKMFPLMARGTEERVRG